MASQERNLYYYGDSDNGYNPFGDVDHMPGEEFRELAGVWGRGIAEATESAPPVKTVQVPNLLAQKMVSRTVAAPMPEEARLN